VLKMYLNWYWFFEKIYETCVIFEGKCGSCYAFSSLAMYEARLRIVSNNSIQLTFAPQDIVDCSKYSQGTYLPLLT